MLKHHLRERLVHRHRAGLHARSGVGNPQDFEQTLDRAVLAAHPMERNHGEMRLDIAQPRCNRRIHIERDRVIAQANERSPDRLAAADRNLAFGGLASHEHRDALRGEHRHS